MIKEWTEGMPWHRLATITRYSVVPKIHKESVAEHTFFVALYSYAMAIEIESKGVEVDIEDLLRRAIVHDIDEAVTGDFPRTFKHMDSEIHSAISKATIRAMDEVHQMPGVMYADWVNHKDPDFVGMILQFADLWSSAAWAAREVNLGNSSGHEVLLRIPDWLHEISWPKALRLYVDELVTYCIEITKRRKS